MIQITMALIFIFCANLIHHQNAQPILEISKQESTLNLNNKIIHFNFGLKRFLSSLLWVETTLNSDHDKYKKKDLNSWMYLRFDTILKLDPKFLRAYIFGGQYLSVVKDDPMGAKEIYDRGLAMYPNDYDLNYFAGFHYFHEIHDPKKTIELYRKIANHPKAPQFLASTVASLMKTENYSIQDALMLLVQSYYHVQDPTMKEEYRKKIVKLGGDPKILLNK